MNLSEQITLLDHMEAIETATLLSMQDKEFTYKVIKDKNGSGKAYIEVWNDNEKLGNL